VLGHGQAGQRNAGTRSRRLVHLAIHQGCLGALAAAFLVHARFDHFPVKVVALAGTLTHTGKHRVTTVCLGDVVDQFHDQNGLAHAGTTEQADLAALGVRRQQVHDLDARHEDFGFRRLLDEFRCFLVDGALGLGLDRTGFVNRLADHVHDAAKGFVTHRHLDRRAGVGHVLTTHQAFGGVHGDGAHGVFAQVLRHFQNQPVTAIVGFQRVENFRQVTRELHVDDSAHDLGNLAGLSAAGRCLRRRRLLRCSLLGRSFLGWCFGHCSGPSLEP
jgi:hypothetical protein